MYQHCIEPVTFRNIHTADRTTTADTADVDEMERHNLKAQQWYLFGRVVSGMRTRILLVYNCHTFDIANAPKGREGLFSGFLACTRQRTTMPLNPDPTLLNNLYWITLVAVVVSSASGVLKAGFQQFDLFGVVIIAIAVGLGGGSLRDILLDREVFWIRDQVFFIASLTSAIVIFIGARLVKISPRLFLIPDAAGLAAFAIAGTLVALTMDIPWMVASFMGVMTGIMGGIFRDLLCSEPPVVFQSPLYATVSWAGSLMFIGLLYIELDVTMAAIISGLSIFIARLLAIYFDLGLPRFRFKP